MDVISKCCAVGHVRGLEIVIGLVRISYVALDDHRSLVLIGVYICIMKTLLGMVEEV